MIQGLLDGDLFAFRVACTCESKVVDEYGEEQKAVLPVELAYWRLNELLEKTLAEIGTDDFEIFLTDSDGNFRKTVYDEYKANRKDKPRPILLKPLEDFLIESWGAIRAVGQEADDMLGIYQTTNRETHYKDSVIVTIDKDLNQVPGKHYRFIQYINGKPEFAPYSVGAYDVSEEDAQYFFYQQLLRGDATDNIAGCPGIGEKKAEKLLRPYYGNEQEMIRVIFDTYRNSYPELGSEELENLITMTGRLVYIRREPNELWTIPEL